MTSFDSYEYEMPGAAHWSLRIRRGMQLTMTDITGQGNVAMLFYNPDLLSERYNAPDTLKCQHTFKLTTGHCLYSDMGRIFCSITSDGFGWHETVCGTIYASHVKERWGERNYQTARNNRYQNGYDSFLVELAKYGLSRRDLAANVNFFSRIEVEDDGRLIFGESNKPKATVTLRFEMDTLVILHTCPHPLNPATEYPFAPIAFQLSKAPVIATDDVCLNHCPENRRGFANNTLYYLGA